MSNHNLWNNSWGSQTNRESNPTSQWSWNQKTLMWEYYGPPESNSPVSPPSIPPTTIYKEDDVDCDPVGGVFSSNDPSEPITSTAASPGIGLGRPNIPNIPSAQSSPPVSTNPIPAKVGGKMYNVCFDDALLNQKGWTRSRWEGSKLQSLYYNEYTGEMEEGKPLGPSTSKDVENFIDGLHFLITGSVSPTGSYKRTIGDPFEKPPQSGITLILENVYVKSTQWQTEFRSDLSAAEKYPPKHPNGVDGAGKAALYVSGSPNFGKKFPNAPFGPPVMDIPSIPTTFYKTNETEVKDDATSLINNQLVPQPLKLHTAGIIGNTGTHGEENLYQVSPINFTHDGSLATEHAIKFVSRSYNYLDGGGNVLPEANWTWTDTSITQSSIIPRRERSGDITYGKEPVISTFSNALFFGTTTLGHEESELYPGPGPDFSFIKLEKAFIFDSDTDEFFIQEIKRKGDNVGFEKLMQSTFPWASTFKLRLLDYEHPNNLKTEYGVHWNKGYFSKVASYTTESSHHQPQGHFPGTGTGFDIPSWLTNTGNSGNIEIQTSSIHNAGIIIEGSPNCALGVEANGGGGFYYLASDKGGGDGAMLYGSFKSAGMGFGSEMADFPKHPTPSSAGSFIVGPGYGSFMGTDPFPSGMRYYESQFQPIGEPLSKMNQYRTNGGGGGDVPLSGRVLSGTFEINKSNPSINWWFEQGGQKDIYWVSESRAGDVSASLKTFMDDCYKQDALHIITYNKAKNTDKTFGNGFERFDHSFRLTPGNNAIPGYSGTAAANYLDAVPGDDVNSAYSFYRKFTRPLVTFGSTLFSDYTKVGVLGAHTTSSHNLYIRDYDYSPEAIQNGTIKTGPGPVGGITMYGINPPRFLNGVPYVHCSDMDGYYQDANNSNANVFNSISAYTGYMYANNWTYATIDGINFPERKGWPTLNTWVISKEEKRPNVILTDLNKQLDLPDGEGSKGFILIPDNLNPRIKANLDYYLKKSGLIGVAPRFKDKTIKKNAYLPTKLDKRNRGWFWRFKKKLKTKYKK